jgi:hypothetical protein
MIMSNNNFATHSTKHVGRGESFSFSPFQLNNITIALIS